MAALTGLAANYVVCIGLDQASLAWKPHLLLYGAIGIATALARTGNPQDAITPGK